MNKLDYILYNNFSVMSSSEIKLKNIKSNKYNCIFSFGFNNDNIDILFCNLEEDYIDVISVKDPSLFNVIGSIEPTLMSIIDIKLLNNNSISIYTTNGEVDFMFGDYIDIKFYRRFISVTDIDKSNMNLRTKKHNINLLSKIELDVYSSSVDIKNVFSKLSDAIITGFDFVENSNTEFIIEFSNGLSLCIVKTDNTKHNSCIFNIYNLHESLGSKLIDINIHIDDVELTEDTSINVICYHLTTNKSDLVIELVDSDYDDSVSASNLTLEQYKTNKI